MFSKRGKHHVADQTLGVHGNPEVALQDLADPGGVLKDQGAIEAHGLAQLFLGLFRGHGAEQSIGDVARGQMHQQEDKDRDPEENGNDRCQPA